MQSAEERRWWNRAVLLVLYRGLSDAAAKSVTFAITVGAARRLSRDEFGLFAIATTIGWLASVGGDFGIQVHLARAVSQDAEGSASQLHRWLPIRLFTGALACALMLTIPMLVDFGPGALFAVSLFTLAYAATGVCECLYYYFRGNDRSDLESSLTLLHRLTLAVLAVAVLWIRPRLDLLGAAMLVSALLTLTLALRWALALSRQRMVAPSYPRPIGREFLQSVAPIGIGILLSALYFRLDVFLVEWWVGTSAVALYSAVFRLIDALRLFPAAVIAVALPALCRANDAGTVTRLAAPLTAAAAAAATVLWFSAGWLVPALYGTAYVSSVPFFRILLLALPLMFLNYALTHQVIGWHRHHAYAAACAAALAGNLLLNALLIPRIGAAGAAWATVWTEAILTAGCVLILSRADGGAARRAQNRVAVGAAT